MKATVISSFAKDILLKGEKIEKCRGGPAFFITKTLEKLNIPYNLFCGEEGIVEINLENGIERGKVKKIGKIEPQKDNMNFLLVSTLLNEFKLKPLGKFNCVDIQGYVRDKNNTIKKSRYYCKELKKFDIVKATKEELQYIPKEIKKKIKIILETNGDKGFIVSKGEKKYYFSVEKIKTTDTIGAGDTFFTAFCLKYYQTKDIVKSARYSQKITSNFLISKMEVGK
jgi:hypothetical protein